VGRVLGPSSSPYGLLNRWEYRSGSHSRLLEGGSRRKVDIFLFVITQFDIVSLHLLQASMTKSNRESISELEEMSVEDPPRAESLYCKTKSNAKATGDLEEMSVEDPPRAESLYCKKDGKRPFVKDFQEEMPPEEPSVGDALAEVKRGRLKNVDLALAPSGDPPDRLPKPDKDPLDRHAAGPREEPADRHANPPGVPVVRRVPVSYPGAYRVHGPEHSSSAISVDSDGAFTTRAEDAVPSQPPDAQCSLPPSSSNDPSMDTDAKCVNRRVMYWVAGIALLLAIIATVVGIVVSGDDPKDTPSPVNAATMNGVCSIQDIFSECQDGASIFASDIPDCALEQYDSLLGLLTEIVPSLVDMEETSCAPENLALLTLEANEENSTDKYILNVFYFSTSGHEWFDSSGWLSTEYQCEWWGIVCNDEGVIESLETESNNLSGSIPTELGVLTDLSRLALSKNTLSGTIPTEFGLLAELSHLFLGINDLNGTIPTELGLLTELSVLVLVFNKLTGSIPTELGLLTELSKLALFVNTLSGSIPTELGLLTELLELYLYQNTLSGTIPTELGLLTELSLLYLYDNTLTGTIPTELGLLTELSELYLWHNSLSGSIPSSLCGLNVSIFIDCGDITCTCCECGMPVI
jgi:Leucine-rich repeat (LRR) protein